MTPDDIAKARATILTARNPPSVSGCRYCESANCDTDCSFAERHFGVVRKTAAAVRSGALHEPLTGWSAALDEVDRITGLHAEEHAQNERMCSEIERLDREVAQLRARVASYDAAVCDRVGTIASEAFGPLPVQSAASSLTAIEQGIAKRVIVEALEKAR